MRWLHLVGDADAHDPSPSAAAVPPSAPPEYATAPTGAAPAATYNNGIEAAKPSQAAPSSSSPQAPQPNTVTSLAASSANQVREWSQKLTTKERIKHMYKSMGAAKKAALFAAGLTLWCLVVLAVFRPSFVHEADDEYSVPTFSISRLMFVSGAFGLLSFGVLWWRLGKVTAS